MNLRLLIFIFLIGISFKCFPQAINWQTAAGGPNNSWPMDMQTTPDGGFVILVRLASTTTGFEVTDPPFSPNGSSFDYWVVKYGSDRKIEWQKRLGGIAADNPTKIRLTSDGQYLVGGTSSSLTNGNKTESSSNEDAWVVKLDHNGNIVWQNTIRALFAEYLRCMDVTLDNGMILGIQSNSGVGLEKTESLAGTSDMWLVKIDSLGGIEWQNTLSFLDLKEAYFYDIIHLADGGYAAVGIYRYYSTSYYLGALYRLDAQGNLLWKIDDLEGTPYKIVETPEKGLIIACASTNGIGPMKSENCIGYSDVWVLKLDSVGGFVWGNTIGGVNTEWPSDIQLEPNGYIYMVGASNSREGVDKSESCHGSGDNWVLKLDSNGVKIWDKTVGATRDDRGVSIGVLQNGDILVASSSYSRNNYDRLNFIRGFSDSWLFTLTENYNEVTGSVFTDINGNMTQDTGDFIPVNKIIQTSESQFSFVAMDGKYRIPVLDSTCTITPQLVPYYTHSPVMHSANFIGFNQIDSLNNFTFSPLAAIQDLQLSMVPPTIVQPGINATYFLTCQNNGTVSVSGEIYFRLYPHVNYVSSSNTPSLLTQDSVLWNIGFLSPGQSKSISVTIQPDTILQAGVILNSRAEALPVVTDYNPSDNTATWELTVGVSYDPNDIIVNLKSLEVSSLINSPKLTYTIRFQNTGTAAANKVRLINNIPRFLLASSFQLNASSHPVSISYLPHSRALQFDFPGIILPDSASNLTQSMGFVQYSIETKTDLQIGDSIRNQASIYFDYNDPIETNYAITEIISTNTSSIEIWPENKLYLFPNPVKDNLTLKFKDIFHKGEWTIFDIGGRKVLEDSFFAENELVINGVRILNRGIYLIEIRTGQQRYYSKFIKE